MAPTPSQPTVNDKIMVGSILVMVSERITASLDVFAGWVLAGFGAALAFLLGNAASIEGFLEIDALRRATKIFVWAAVIGVIGRYLGSAIAAIAAAGTEGERLGEKHAEKITLEGLFSEMEKAAPWFARWWVRRSFNKVRNGDFSASGRFLAGWAIFHSTLVFIGLCFAIWALATIAYGIKTSSPKESAHPIVLSKPAPVTQLPQKSDSFHFAVPLPHRPETVPIAEK